MSWVAQRRSVPRHGAAHERTWRLWLGAALLTTVTASPAGAQYYAPDPPPADVPWYELVELRAFIDAYASLNYNFPKPHTGANLFRAYDQNTGFALSWVGLDASFEPDPVGGTLSLRYGPSADQLADRCLHQDPQANPCDGDVDLEMVKQAYGSFRPDGTVGVLRFDFGKFDSTYGIEVAEGFQNVNYTRGLLYTLVQPVFFTGLRVNVKPLPDMQLNFLVASGQNSTLDNNFGKTFGAQLALTPTPSFSALFGWVTGPEQDDSLQVDCPAGEAYSAATNACAPDPTDPPAATYGIDRPGVNDFDAYRHQGDLVLRYRPSSHLGFAFNGVFGLEGVRPMQTNSGVETAVWYGGALSVAVPLTRVWAVGLRGEYLADLDGRLTGIDDAKLMSATVTVDAIVAANFMLRLDNRADVLLSAAGSDDVFPVGVIDEAGSSDARSYQITTTLGVLVYTN
jgi:hypothetical protein